MLNMKQGHTIEIFSADCPLCRRVSDIIEVGKCAGCKQIVYDINKVDEKTKEKMKSYGITAVPTTVIDGKIKVVGIPSFPWFCGDEFYEMLKKEYPLRK